MNKSKEKLNGKQKKVANFEDLTINFLNWG